MNHVPFWRRSHITPILQAEAAECGLACVAMVAGYHGYEIDLASLRRRFGLSNHGANLRAVMQIASLLQLSSRPLRLELKDLSQLRLPAILHWDLNHFVVLKAVNRRSVTIVNPAAGERNYPLQELSRHFTGVAIELTPTQSFEARQLKARLRISDFWQQTTGLQRALTQVLMLSLLLQLFALASPFYVQMVVDEALTKQDAHLITLLALGFALVMLVRVATTALRSWVLMVFSNALGVGMASNLFRHLLRLPLAWFQRRHLGDVLSRFGALKPIKQLLSEGIVAALVDGLMALTTLVMMAIYDWRLTAVVVGAVLLYALIRVICYPLMRRRTEEGLAAAAREDSSFMESIRAIQSIKLFAAEDARHSLWLNRQAEVITNQMTLGKLNIGYGFANGLLFGAENILVVYLGANLVLEQGLTIGMLYAFMSYKGHFTERVSALVDRALELKMLGLHLERLSDIALEPTEAGVECANERTLVRRPVQGCIELIDVSFRYAQGEPDVLKAVNLRIEPSECVALVGASGLGKTTLLKILMGLHAPSQGEVRIDGQPLNGFGLADYRAGCAAVMQEDLLLAGSIADNISFFDAEPDWNWLNECVSQAGINEDIMRMPMRLDTLIGDMGAALSAGQRQRILLARALYRRPRLLFLDEVTSHLDVASAQVVRAMLHQLLITRVLVTHDPAMASMADRVFRVMPGGMVEEQTGAAVFAAADTAITGMARVSST